MCIEDWAMASLVKRVAVAVTLPVGNAATLVLSPDPCRVAIYGFTSNPVSVSCVLGLDSEHYSTSVYLGSPFVPITLWRDGDIVRSEWYGSETTGNGCAAKIFVGVVPRELMQQVERHAALLLESSR
jgi:hypothetical protein